MSGHTRRDALKRLGAAGSAGVVALAGCSQQEDGGEGGETTESGSGGDTETSGDDGGESGGEAINLGSLFPITGTNSPYGGGHQQAFNLAVEEVNAAGGPMGRTINP
ncbi:twin-arginine translocation signal domain-containing protein [Haloarculaceae archaeon H-GB2-1]|nr:twin-arginine translocation signal domain-containing protein [Haloarculaceae archaeon H-GB11]MEA5409528.1 twin-arginine translocation signal domain-containing protein [Haloarculaceae archaeon H-GB2-1]